MAEQPKATGGQPYQSTGVSNTPVEARPNTRAQAGIDKNLAKRALAISADGRHTVGTRQKQT
jgi:hypothetical protein